MPAVAVEGSAADSPSCLSKAPASEDTRSAQPSGPHSRPPRQALHALPPVGYGQRHFWGARVSELGSRRPAQHGECCVPTVCKLPLFKFQKKRNPKHSCVDPAILREGERPRRRLASARRRETQ